MTAPPFDCLFPSLKMEQGGLLTRPQSGLTSLACQVPLGHYAGPHVPFTRNYTLFSGEGLIREDCERPNLASMTLWIERFPSNKTQTIEFAIFAVGFLLLNKNQPPSEKYPVYLRGMKPEELSLLRSVMSFLVDNDHAVTTRLTGHTNRFFPGAIGRIHFGEEILSLIKEVKMALSPSITTPQTRLSRFG